MSYFGPDATFQGKLISSLTWRINSLSRRLFDKTAIGDHNRVLSRHLGRFFQKQIAKANLDILFAPAASIEIAYLETDIPIVYLSDTTWHDIQDYYEEFGSFTSLAEREGDKIEARAIAKASAVVYPTQWPARAAREHYGAPGDKVFVYPFGANLDNIPPRDLALQHTLDGTLELLWVGIDWVRKGGGIVVDCLHDLRRSGIDAHLTVCGCVPPFGQSDPHITVIPFLDKRDPAQQQTLSELFLRAHFFVFPTRAEAFGIVVAEASAHGVPSLAADTGGVSGVLSDGENGFLLPFNASGADYASRMRVCIADRAKYANLVRSSRDAFEDRLNWDAWGESMRSVMLNVLDGKRN
jgi:glycosyltransferase involved in cell wall biosynthesis